MKTTSCFVKCNTKEVREKVLQLGFKERNEFKPYALIELNYIESENGTFILTNYPQSDKPEFIDCGDDVDFFMKLITTR